MNYLEKGASRFMACIGLEIHLVWRINLIWNGIFSPRSKHVTTWNLNKNIGIYMHVLWCYAVSFLWPEVYINVRPLRVSIGWWRSNGDGERRCCCRMEPLSAVLRWHIHLNTHQRIGIIKCQWFIFSLEEGRPLFRIGRCNDLLCFWTTPTLS